MSGGKDSDYMKFCRDFVNEKEKEYEAETDMLLTEFIDAIGLDVNDISMKELPFIARLSQDIRNLRFEINELKKRSQDK